MLVERPVARAMSLMPRAAWWASKQRRIATARSIDCTALRPLTGFSVTVTLFHSLSVPDITRDLLTVDVACATVPA